MANHYYQVVDTMEKMNLNPDYMTGWMEGFLHHRMREVQNRTPEYEAGYNDGHADDTSHLPEHVRH